MSKKFVTFKGQQIISFPVFRENYIKRNPDKIPVQGQYPDKPIRGKAEIGRLTIAFVIFCLIAVNILSASHTIPFIQGLYELGDVLEAVVGLSGFLAIEGFVVLLMTQNKRSKMMWAVIALGFFSALFANLYETFNIFTSGVDTVYWTTYVIAFLFGLFAPAGNLIGGEVLHSLSKERREQDDNLKLEYNTALALYKDSVQQIDLQFAEATSKFNTLVATQYKNYCKKNYKDLSDDDIYNIMEGLYDDYQESVQIVKAETEVSTNTDIKLSKRAKDLIPVLVASGYNKNNIPKAKYLKEAHGLNPVDASNVRKVFSTL